MPGNNGYRSRKTRYEKRRSNTKLINWLSLFGVLLVLVVISISIFGNKDDEDKLASQQEEDNSEEKVIESNEEPEESVDEMIDIPVVTEEETIGEADAESEITLSEETDIMISSVESDDPNVKLAYVGNWRPVGTEQTGPHTIQFEKDSQDREEMMLAVEQAINLPTEDLTVWWVGRAGDQQVEITTSSNANQAEIYRVHLQWIDNQGWQPTLVEELIENDAPTATKPKEDSEQETEAEETNHENEES